MPGKFREHLVVTQKQLMLVARVRLVGCSRCHDTIIASETSYYCIPGTYRTLFKGKNINTIQKYFIITSAKKVQ
jgi:hypothetical protein